MLHIHATHPPKRQCSMHLHNDTYPCQMSQKYQLKPQIMTVPKLLFTSCVKSASPLFLGLLFVLTLPYVLTSFLSSSP